VIDLFNDARMRPEVKIALDAKTEAAAKG